MTVSEYVQMAKKELDEFEAKWIIGEENDNWPHDLDEGEWCDQEMAVRFGG